MVMQRIFSRPSGRKCLSCDWPIEELNQKLERITEKVEKALEG